MGVAEHAATGVQFVKSFPGDVSMTTLTRRDFGKAAGTLAIGVAATSAVHAQGQNATPDERARDTEQKMTDDERFSLIISLLGPASLVPRDARIPADVKNVSAGYTSGIPRLGIPALQSSDASMGVTNPGYRPDDKGATAFPASILASVRASIRGSRAKGAWRSGARRAYAASTSCWRAG